MKTAEMKLNREIVSEAEWLIARRDLLAREKNSLAGNVLSAREWVSRHDQY